MSSPTMSVDTDTLGQLYTCFQPTQGQTPWNSDDGTQSYFISQGSEYVLKKPAYGDGVVTQDIIDSVNAVATEFGALVSGKNPDLASQLNDWATQFATVPLNTTTSSLMTVTTTVTHINNNLGDDTASLTYTYVYCDPIGLPILVYHDVTVDWSGTLQSALMVAHFGKSVGQFTGEMKQIVRLLGEGAELADVIPGLQVVTIVGIACTVAIMIGKTIISRSDDGGRLNLFAVLTHALNRISSCVRPNVNTPASPFPVMNGDAINAGWLVTTKKSTVSNWTAPVSTGVFYVSGIGSTFDQSGVTWNTVYGQPYEMGMPELSWGMGSLPFVLASTKISMQSDSNCGDSKNKEKSFALALLVYGKGGNVTSYVLQCVSGNSNYVIASPAWLPSPSTDPTELSSDLIPDIGDQISETGASSIASRQLAWVVPEVLQYMCNAMVEGTSPSGEPAGTGPQPCITSSLTKNDPAWYTAGTRPSVMVRPDGTVIDCHDDHLGGLLSNVSSLYWCRGKISSTGTAVTWEGGGGTQIGSGAWPAVCTNPTANGIVLLFFTDSNDIKTTQTTTEDLTGDLKFSDASKVAGGDHSSACMSSDAETIVLYAGGNNDLSYVTATSTDSSLNPIDGTWTANGYRSGDYPTILRSGTTSAMLEVHNDSQHLYFNTGTLSSDKKTITWTNNVYSLDQAGSHPHLADLGNGYFFLSYDNDNNFYAAFGKLDSGTPGGVRWYQRGILIRAGQYPSVCAIPSQRNSVVLCYNDTTNNLVSMVLTANMPTSS